MPYPAEMNTQQTYEQLSTFIAGNRAFYPQDAAYLSQYLQCLLGWDKNLAAMRYYQQGLEAAGAYFADRYALVVRHAERSYQATKYQLLRRLRDERKLKGEALDAALWDTPEYQQAKVIRDEAQALAGIFDKLYWSTVRKHSRIQDQHGQDARTGG